MKKLRAINLSYLQFGVIFGLIGLGLWGCASLQPGADPLVVRVEQAETTAPPLFDLVLGVDNANRPWWRSNVLAYHQFCEWLRDTNSPTGMPRAIALVQSVDQVKLTYKSAKTAQNSNTLQTVLLSLEGAIAQATAWAMVATNTTIK